MKGNKMKKKQKCVKCGGAYTVNVPNSFFEREEHLVIKCPYCSSITSMMIEDGKLIPESEASTYLRSLPQKQVETEPWVQLIK